MGLQLYIQQIHFDMNVGQLDMVSDPADVKLVMT